MLKLNYLLNEISKAYPIKVGKATTLLFSFRVAMWSILCSQFPDTFLRETVPSNELRLPKLFNRMYPFSAFTDDMPACVSLYRHFSFFPPKIYTFLLVTT